MSHMHKVIGTAVTLLSLTLLGHSEALAVPLLQWMLQVDTTMDPRRPS
jgi:hypothetical protein